MFVSAFHVQSLGFKRGLDSHWLRGAQKLARDRGVDARAAESQATGLSHHDVHTIATIYGLPRPSAGIAYHQTASTTPTAHNTRQKRAPAPSRFGSAYLAMGVRRELLLVPFELRPINVTLMMFLEHHVPLVAGFAVAVALAGVSIDDRGALFALTVGVDPA